MDLHDKIVGTYPEITNADFMPTEGAILLKDDGDGIQYIAKWDYSKPLPDGLKLGK